MLLGREEVGEAGGRRVEVGGKRKKYEVGMF
jgi:hypothetical protein